MSTSTSLNLETPNGTDLLTPITKMGIGAAALVISSAVAGRVYQVISPVGGAVYGAVYGGVFALGLMFQNQLALESEVAKIAVVASAATLAAWVTVLVTGFSASIWTGMQLGYLMVPNMVLAFCVIVVVDHIFEHYVKMEEQN